MYRCNVSSCKNLIMTLRLIYFVKNRPKMLNIKKFLITNWGITLLDVGKEFYGIFGIFPIVDSLTANLIPSPINFFPSIHQVLMIALVKLLRMNRPCGHGNVLTCKRLQVLLYYYIN